MSARITGSGCLGLCRFSWSAAFPAVGLRAAALRLRRRPAAAACEDGRYGARRQHRGKDRRHQTVNADVDVAIFELDRRSVRPDLQLCQILRRHVVKRADPLPGDQKSGIPRREDLDGVAVRHVTDRLGVKFPLPFQPAGSKGNGEFRIGNLVVSHRWAKILRQGFDEPLVDPDLAGALTRVPEVALHLQPQPGIGRAAEHLFEPDRHVRRDAGMAVQQIR